MEAASPGLFYRRGDTLPINTQTLLPDNTESPNTSLLQNISMALSDVQAQLSDIQEQNSERDSTLKQLESDIKELKERKRELNGDDDDTKPKKSRKSPCGLSVSFLHKLCSHFL